MWWPKRQRAARLVVILSLVLAGCDGGVHVRGLVLNSQGTPIPGAKIHVTNMDEFWRTESRADGCFLGGGTSDPMHSFEPLTVAALGYKTATAKIRTRATPNRVIVTLVPSDSAAVNRIQLLAADLDKKRLARCDNLR